MDAPGWIVAGIAGAFGLVILLIALKIFRGGE